MWTDLMVNKTFSYDFVSFSVDQGKGRQGQVRGDPRRVPVPARGVEGVHRQQHAFHWRKTWRRGNVHVEQFINIFFFNQVLVEIDM